MTAIQLRPAQRKERRAEAHHLDPVVAIGGDGLTPAVMKEADAALTAHGLIKVRVHSDDRVARDGFLQQMADVLNAAPIQHIGKLLVLWRPIPPKDKVEREDRLPGPKLVKLIKFSKSGNHRPQIRKVKMLGNERLTTGGTIKRAKKAPQKSLKKSAID